MKFVKTLMLVLCTIVLSAGTVFADGSDTKDNYVAGTGAGASLTTGNGNLFVGISAGYATTTGSANTALGYSALRDMTTGRGNIAIGYMAGEAHTTGSHDLYIGTRFYPTSGIFGSFDTGFFGINNTAPAVALDVTGAIASSGAITATSIATPTSGVALSIPDSVNVTGVLTVGIIKTATAGTQLSLADSVDISGALTVSGTLNYISKVQTITGDSTLTASMSGDILCNNGAGGAFEITLPVCAAGLQFTFIATDADSLIAVSASGDSIFYSTTGKPMLECHALYATYTIKGVPSLGGQFNWAVTANEGTIAGF